jgi:3-phosphoshikimate 1-carboxyvinyltransferase
VIIRVPGDKSLTQRALILAALASGESRLSGLLYGGDAASTAGAVRALGAELGPIPPDGGELRVRGAGLTGLREAAELDLGNSGTGARLLLGVLAGAPVRTRVTGDASLRRRPMGRVTVPLGRMGAVFAGPEGGERLPLEVRGGRPLRPLEWESPVASAQVKSSLLLAGLTGAARVRVSEPRRSRDHTERLLGHLGVSVEEAPLDGRWTVELRDPPPVLPPLDFAVPGDVSSAAFFLALAALGGIDELAVEGVGLNPTRTAFLDVLERMGASVATEDVREAAGETVGRLVARPGELNGTEVGAEEIPRLIDELPLVAVLGARARGTTRVTDAEELRHKESDRIDALVTNLRALGVEVEERPDGFEVAGDDRPLRGRVAARGDHRIAMAFGVLGALPGNEIEVDHPGAADVSFPGFWDLLRRTAGGPG